MDIYILRIELIRYEIALRHTAFNTREEIYACFCRCRQREWRKQAEPPPAHFFFLSELLNALEAADFVLLSISGPWASLSQDFIFSIL